MARGKIKDDDKYTCPICDWRVKIPRDAARPKLEALQDWQAEIIDLPFRPEEEKALEDIVEAGATFRDAMRPFTNPVMTTPDEVTTQRFYLRKIEGAEILLAFETNYFRQELHRWAPIAPESPPVLENSLSTRKPRPTKIQKEMAKLGVSSPDQLPQPLRTKPHNFNKVKKPRDPRMSRNGRPLAPGVRRKQDPSTPQSATSSNGQDSSSHPEGNTPFTPYFPVPASLPHHEARSPANFTQQPYMSPQTAQHDPQLMLGEESSFSQSGPPMDPSLFSPTNSQFESPTSANSNGQMTASPHGQDMFNMEQQGGVPFGEDVFAEFTNHTEDTSDDRVPSEDEGMAFGDGYMDS